MEHVLPWYLVWRFVYGLHTDPDRLRGDPDREARLWLEMIADANRQRAQDLAVEGLLSPAF